MSHGDLLSFGPFVLDTRTRRLTRDGAEVPLGTRHLHLLCVLASRAGETLSKELLTETAWPGQAITSNSLDQAVSLLRRALPMPSGEPCIETRPRRGYCFVAPVSALVRRASDDSLDAIMETHRAWIEGRAALETLEGGAIVRARAAFERVVEQMPAQATAHVGLANACALQFEMTRTDAEPDVAGLETALAHALEARRLDPKYGEAWATLGFVLERTGRRDDALAAARQSIVLEPDNWRHHLRLSACSWGEERLREARRTLQMLPGLPMAHWLAASVLVARGLLTDAEEEVLTGLTTINQHTPSSALGLVAPLDIDQDTPTGFSAVAPLGGTQDATSRFSPVALNWLLGLILLARGAREVAIVAFHRELDHEHCGHLYVKEVAANSWYAIGAARFTAGDRDAAQEAFFECVKRVPKHLMARAALGQTPPATGPSGVDRAIAQAVYLAVDDDLPGSESAASAIERALAEAPGGNAGWLLPVEPMLAVARCPERWLSVLARLRSRAA